MLCSGYRYPTFGNLTKPAHKVLAGNAARLFGFDLDLLAGQREEVTSRLQ